MFSVKKITLFFFILLFVSVSAQHKHKSRRKGGVPFFHSPIGIETHLVPSDSLFTCFISFKVNFNNLVFVKDRSQFKSGISLAIEIKKDGKTVDRVIKKSGVLVDDYDLTTSKYLFLQDVASVVLHEGEYTLNPLASLENTDIDAKLKPINVVIDSTQLSFPIIVYKEKIVLNSNKVYTLANSENTIPYSINKYDLLIPVFDQSINSVDVEIFQRGKIKLKKKISEYEKLNMKLDSYDDQVVIIDDDQYPTVRLFKIDYVNQKLDEGMSRITVTMNGKNEEYHMPILWYNKPRSLRDPESAIEMLNLIGKSEQADSLLDFPDEEYYHVLYDYWKKYDNDTTTAFNEVFDEYYTRIDYANKNFKSLSGDSGAESDRGITYIRYGKPDSTERSYNEKYNIIEIWDYKSLGLKIYFSDKTGTGDFVRIK
ncbi:hypothetical protein MNBD_IGNAVI01-287 [hydrothermal vent metagenome]|uniref:GWxTD domain-containing protein n=1 Tax=hydrothermal vent metagenome TaxID=652676 RepID=A0A3B1D3V6_9ZZZZ